MPAPKIVKIKMTADDTSGMSQVPDPLHRTSSAYLFVAPPGSGKTNLLMNLISLKGKYYNKLFDQVHFWSPSKHTIKDLPLPPERQHSDLNLKELDQIIKSIEGTDERGLFIFDDMVATLGKNIKQFLKLLYNRRHIGKGVHIWITTQKLTKVPLELRAAMNGLFVWPTSNKTEAQTLYDEYISLDKKQWELMKNQVMSKQYAFMFIRLDRHESDKYYDNNFNNLLV